MGTIFVDNLQPQSGTSLTLGTSGDSINLASGATAGFGKVLQAVSNTYASGQIQTTSSAMTDAISQAITPATTSSKVLVLLCFNFHFASDAYGVGGRILRDSTTIMTDSADSASPNAYYHTYLVNQNFYGKANYSVLDSPSTTSSTTYKYQFGSYRNGYESRFAQQGGAVNSTATMTLLEIAG